MIRVVHEDRFFRVEHNDEVLRVARTSERSAPDAAAYAAVERAIATAPSGSRLFLDLREARDSEAVVQALQTSFARFKRAAVLTKGKLTLPGVPGVSVFDDEDRAFDHLLARKS